MEDIPEFAAHFWGEASGGRDPEKVPLDGKLLETLQRYNWPGNVRELRNAIFYTHRMAANRVPSAEDLPPRILAEAISCACDESVKGLVDRHMLTILEKVGWNRSKAARLLGITRQGLAKRLKKMGIEGARRKRD